LHKIQSNLHATSKKDRGIIRHTIILIIVNLISFFLQKKEMQ